jgi:tetraacyldisaccharide 4'-kinase
MTANSDARLKRLFFWGRPFSPLYSFFMTIRSTLYRKGFLKQFKLEVPVISVGNLVLGGTGKTPLVLHMADLLKQLGYKPAILSRGYKGSATDAINIVSNISEILLDAESAGDEPRLLAEKLPGIPVITGRKRYITGRLAIDSFGADILILDDGFQHLALQRNIDLLLFNGRKGLGNGHVLPGGDLREPLPALNRASAFIVSDINASESGQMAEITSLLKNRYPDKPLFTASYQPENILLRLQNDKYDAISFEKGNTLPLYGFCGIANPDSFEITLRKRGINLIGFKEFPDHHDYSSADIRQLTTDASLSGAAGLITTEKDLVKLHHKFPPENMLIAQPIKLLLPDEFDRYLTEYLKTVIKP